MHDLAWYLQLPMILIATASLTTILYLLTKNHAITLLAVATVLLIAGIILVGILPIIGTTSIIVGTCFVLSVMIYDAGVSPPIASPKQSNKTVKSKPKKRRSSSKK